LQKLKDKVEEHSETFETKYQVGELALVTKGPFEGNEGIITEINDKKGIVKLNINLLGRETPIELDF
jgi:transcriptional antiterminator NusG